MDSAGFEGQRKGRLREWLGMDSAPGLFLEGNFPSQFASSELQRSRSNRYTTFIRSMMDK